jgi:amino acid adenylation domain-containing protein
MSVESDRDRRLRWAGGPAPDRHPGRAVTAVEPMTTEVAVESPSTLSDPGQASQWRLWSASIIHADSAPYVITAAYELRGPVDLDRVASALRGLPVRHPGLTVRYELADARLEMTPEPDAEVEMEIRDELADADLAGLVEDSLAGWVWDLAVPPHLRATLWRLAPDRVLLVVGAHHIAADAWGFDQMMKDFAGLYTGVVEAVAPEIPADLSASAPAVSVRRSVDHWTREFAEGAPAPLNLPLPHASTGQLGTLLHDEAAFALPDAFDGAASGVTPGTGVSALFGAYLALLSGQDEIFVVYPTPLPGLVDRNAAGAGVPMSSMTSLGVLRVGASPESTVSELFRLAQRRVLAGMRYPYGALEAWAAHREPGSATLPNVIVQWLAGTDEWATPTALAPVEIAKVPTPLWVSEFDLDLWVTGRWGALTCRLGFRPDRVPAEAVARLVDGFTAFFSAAVADPATPLGRLPLTGTAKTGTAVADGASVVAPAPGRQDAATVTAMLGNNVGVATDIMSTIVARPSLDPAIETAAGTMTYADLVARIDVWARVLRARIAPGARVAVDLAPGTAPETLYGIWAAAGVYVPLVAEVPLARIRHMLEASGATAVVTDRPDWYRENFPDLTVIDPSRLDDEPGPLKDWSYPDPAAPAYVVFTSGSTGLPKAVEATHANLLHAVRSWQAVVGVPAGARIAQTSAPVFDPSLLEILLAVEVGGVLVVCPAEVRRDPRALARWLADERIDVVEATPTVWTELVGPLAGTGHRIAVCASGGEVLSDRLATRIAEVGATVWNMYGPSETSIWATVHRCGTGTADEPPSIGRPLPDVEIRVVNPAGQELPDGYVGEIVITGAGLTRGYPNDAEMTALRFAALPGDERIWYRSGDRGWRDGSELHFAGRADRQVKLSGKRIDPAEVEFALAAHPEVRAAVVVVGTVPGREGRALCAYVTHGPELDRSDLLLHLKEQLPRHAVPAVLVCLDELPRTATGKIDATALPDSTDADLLTRATAYEPPATPTEVRVAEAFAQVLGAGTVGALDDFFDLGGTSLSGLRLGRLLESLVGKEVQVATIYDGATVRGIAALLDKS